MKRVYLSLLFLAVVAIASPASACENCKSIAGNTTCWSGDAVGYDYCYGGWGIPCEMGGYCDERMGAPSPFTSEDAVCTAGPLGCTSQLGAVDAAPSGFVLDKPATVAVKRPAIREAS